MISAAPVAQVGGTFTRPNTPGTGVFLDLFSATMPALRLITSTTLFSGTSLAAQLISLVVLFRGSLVPHRKIPLVGMLIWVDRRAIQNYFRRVFRSILWLAPPTNCRSCIGARFQDRKILPARALADRHSTCSPAARPLVCFRKASY